MNKIQQIFKNRSEKVIPFLTAGYPKLNDTVKMVLSAEKAGAEMVEIGMPFSDPLADGPTIQLAASRALSSGTSPAAVLEMLSDLRGKLNIPVILFTYSNPLLNFGIDNFCKHASQAGASGLVVPDVTTFFSSCS